MKRFALFGWPLITSLSPAMFNAAFRALGIPAEYEVRPLLDDELIVGLEELRHGSLAAANVTVPHKVSIMEHLPHLSPAAEQVGAVNVVARHEDGRLAGDNTDVAGFRKVVEGLGLADGTGQRAVVFGAGGAARAAIVVLVESGYRVEVLNRTTLRALQLMRDFSAFTDAGLLNAAPLDMSTIAAYVPTAQVLVNATPATGGDDADWLGEVDLGPGMHVIDLVSWPLVTPLVAGARRAGAMAIGGLPMLVVQAALAFEQWTGEPAPTQLMRDAAVNEAERLANELETSGVE
jgi:shikimate dehydrogenase